MDDVTSEVVDSAEEARALFAPGKIVDHFRIMRLVGRGGMGEVYVARDTRLGRKVALKVIHPEKIGSKKETASFLFEARAMARLSHPHIVAVYTVGDHHGHPYVALEYLEGQSLRQRLKEERPGTREAVRFGEAIAAALAEAHRNKVLHRDLKPENVLIPRDGRLRVVDFGLAKIIRGAEGDEEAADSVDSEPDLDSGLAEVRGTPAYMAPEQWMEKECTEATDIWALGVILYEMISGRSPYEGASIMELALKVCGPDPIPPMETLHDIPGDLRKLILRCLEKEPGDRPGTGEVVHRLEGMLVKRRPAAEQSPFRGLLPFDERHADLFFGRDQETSAFLERIREQPVLPVVGPSGAGKSSFVQAGVIPRLREHGSWILLQLRPGNQPFLALASRLLSSEGDAAPPGGEHPTADLGPLDDDGEPPRVDGPRAENAPRLAEQLQDSPSLLNLMLQQIADRENSRVLLLVDQLEELYTLTADEQVRGRFMQAVCSAADDPQDPIRVIFTLRDDFLVRLAGSPAAREALSHVTVIRRPDPASLEQTLVEPLKVTQYRFDDPTLAQEMIDAVRGEPAALSLLQFISSVLWDQRDRQRRVLHRAAYEAAGGVAGALANHADGVLDGLSPDQVRTARDILLRLVTGEGTRRVLSRERVLEGLGDEAPEVLKRLTLARLLTVRKAHSDESAAAELELAHQALIQAWGRLRRWIEEGHEELAFLAEASQAAELWTRRGERAGEVWEGDALLDARLKLERCTTSAPGVVTRFLEAGQRRALRRLRRKRLRRFTIIAAVIGALAATAAAALLVAWTIAGNERHARRLLAEAHREGAQSALARGDMLEARAKLRTSLETRDSLLARALWRRLSREPLMWRKELGSFVYSVAFSPDGNLVAAGCQDKSIYLMDVRSLDIKILRGHEDQIFSLVFSPDGKRLASGTWSGKVRVWDLARGTARVLSGHTKAVWSLSFHPSGNQLASASYDRHVRIWDLAAMGRSRVLRGHTDRVRGVRFSPRGDRLATSSYDQTIRVWDTSTWKTESVLKGHSNRVYDVVFTPDGKRLISGSLDKTIRVWDLKEPGRSKILVDHTDTIYGIAVSPDANEIAFGTGDHSIRIHALADGRHRRTLRGHSARAYSVNYSRDGARLLSGSMDKTVRMWDLTTVPEPAVDEGHSAAAFGVAISPDGRLIASGSYDKTIRLWSVATGRKVGILRGHTGVVYNLAFSHDGASLASCSMDKTVRIWDMASRTLARVLVGHERGVTFVTFSRDSKLLASAGWDRSIRIWDPRTGILQRKLSGHTDRVMAIEFSADGKVLASGSMDKTARCWRVDTGAPCVGRPAGTGTRDRSPAADTGVLRAHTAGVYGVAFNPDGRRVITAGLDQAIRVWDVVSNTHRVVRRFSGRAYWISAHPDGERYSVPLSDGTGRIWSLAGGGEVTLRGHRAEVNVIRFSTDGALAVSSSDDQTIRLWDTDTGKPIWRCPVMFGSPPTIYTHRGWINLDAGAALTPPASGWRRAVEQRSRQAAVSAGGKNLCIVTRGSALEGWSIATDRRRFHRRVPGLEQALALPGACVTRAGGQVSLHAVDGTARLLRGEATAVSLDRGEILVAAGKEISTFSSSGELRGTLPAGTGVTAMTRTRRWLALGFEDGNIELSPRNKPDDRPKFTFEGIPSSAVVRIKRGPVGTLVVGYANGFVGIWNLSNGARLFHVNLHGPVVHMRLGGGKLYVATELGNYHVLDLKILDRGYCDLLRDVWRQVPTVWAGGLPVLQPPPDRHRCRR